MAANTSATKRKRNVLSILDKLRIIEKVEAGVSTTKIMEEYNIAKQTVSDIKKSKDKIKEFYLKYNLDNSSSRVSIRKNLRRPNDSRLDEEIYKWYVKQLSEGICVQTGELQSAAERLAKELSIQSFSASNSWLWRFRRRYNIRDRKTCEWPETDTGCENLTHEMAMNVCTAALEEDSEHEDKYDPREDLIKLSKVKDSLDLVIHFIEHTSHVAMQSYCEHLRSLREIVIREELQRKSIKS